MVAIFARGGTCGGNRAGGGGGSIKTNNAKDPPYLLHSRVFTVMDPYYYSAAEEKSQEVFLLLLRRFFRLSITLSTAVRKRKSWELELRREKGTIFTHWVNIIRLARGGGGCCTYSLGRAAQTASGLEETMKDPRRKKRENPHTHTSPHKFPKEILSPASHTFCQMSLGRRRCVIDSRGRFFPLPLMVRTR